jgi:TDG/mug DNA glycosylase family protein
MPDRSRRSNPTREELETARDRLISDVAAPGLRVLFCGINPGLWSAARDQHFARPGNRFWPALHGSGFVPEPLGPDRQASSSPTGWASPTWWPGPRPGLTS